MKLAKSPLAPDAFPELPRIAGVQSATGSRGFYEKRGLQRDDIFLFAFDEGTTCAGVFTVSTTASADVRWCREALSIGHGQARALVANAGNSNAFTGQKGIMKNEATLAAMMKTLSAPKHQCFLAATGVIGEPLPDPNYVGSLVPDLTSRLAQPDWEACARAFMTTDTFPKGAGTRFDMEGRKIHLAGIAKGSGMIAPNMATMLAFVFTDLAISAPVLDELLRQACNDSFNAITVDSDTSTSDTLMVFATGAAGNRRIDSVDHPAAQVFAEQLKSVCLDLALQIVMDGEGAHKFVTIEVEGAETDVSARIIAADIANSPLVKTALAAGDANWGRVVMAVGKSGEPIELDKLSIWFNGVLAAAQGGRAENYSEAALSAECAKSEILIRVMVGQGNGSARIYTCDLTHAYIDINGAYRT